MAEASMTGRYRIPFHVRPMLATGRYRIPFHVRPMLATLVAEAFDKPGWVFEEKGIPLVDAPREKGLSFVAPMLIAQISFQEWTRDRKLRQPVYLGLRDDKSAADVLLPESAA